MRTLLPKHDMAVGFLRDLRNQDLCNWIDRRFVDSPLEMATDAIVTAWHQLHGVSNKVLSLRFAARPLSIRWVGHRGV